MNIVLRTTPSNIVKAKEQQVDVGGGVFYLQSFKKLHRPRFLEVGDTLYLAVWGRVRYACLLARFQYSQFWVRRFWKRRLLTLEWIALRKVGPDESATVNETRAWEYITLGPDEHQRQVDKLLLRSYEDRIEDGRDSLHGSNQAPALSDEGDPRAREADEAEGSG